MPKDRYLEKLPVKSFKVAPGDVVGGLIYVMDKPAGVEEGMVGISIDSESYRDFIKEQLELLKKGNHPYQQLQSRFNQHFKHNASFDSLPLEEQIDKLLFDKEHLVRRIGLTRSDLNKIFFSTGKMHEVRAFKREFENIGMGGLLFKQYKKQLNVKKKDHFAVQIGKLISGGNKVHMVKQDGTMFLGRTGFGYRRFLKTEVGKKFQVLANPFVVAGTAGIAGVMFGGLSLGWRARMFNMGKPEEVNSNAVVETISTKIASIRGFDSQDIETIEGTYEDGTPKIATIVGWSPGCRDLSGKVAGGESDKTNVIFAWDKNGQPLKVDSSGNVLRTKDKDKKGNITSYEKILEDGSVVSISKKEYDKGTMVSEDRVTGLGEALASCICLGDRDGIGEYGQNKVIKPINPPQGVHEYQFYGIDFGKAYEGKNNYVGTLSDDFSFINPTARTQRFLNISILYDNPLREKMKGIYLMAALRNKLSDDQKEVIAKEYESNDPEFANKLRGYPLSLAEKYGEAVGRVLPEGDPNRELWLKNGDLWLLKREENKYRQFAKDAEVKIKDLNQQIEKMKTKEKKKAKQKVKEYEKEQKHYLSYADRLGEVYKIARETDDRVFKVFEKRMTLSPSQIDILDGIEKLTSRKVNTFSPDGKVQLNHLRVERDDRVPWQLEKNADGVTYNLICESTKSLDEIKKKLDRHPSLSAVITSKIQLTENSLSINNLTQEDLLQLHAELAEDKVAHARGLKDYRTKAMKEGFHLRLKRNAELAETERKAATVTPLTPEPVASGPRPVPLPVTEINLGAKVPPLHAAPASAISEDSLGKRKRVVGYAFSSTSLPLAPFPQEGMLTQSNANIKELRSFLNVTDNRNKLDIVKEPKVLPSGTVAISFQKADEPKKVKAYVDEIPHQEALQYSVKKGLEPDAVERAMRHVCELILSTAKPNAELDISVAPPEKRDKLETILHEMLQEAVRENRFTESNKPKIRKEAPALSQEAKRAKNASFD